MSVAISREAPVQEAVLGSTRSLWLTWGLAGVLVAATVFGLFVDGAYRETPARDYLRGTLRGQDLLTLLTVPVLVVAARLARRGSIRGHIVWLGLLLYVTYTYLMYVVVPYNDAFLLYVAAIGLGFYLLLDGLLRIDIQALAPALRHVPRRGVGWFLVVTGGLFGAMWLGQNLAVLPGGRPQGLFVYDVPSTVHVLDLAFVLPLVIATGVMLLRAHPAGPVLAGLVLVKMVTLGLALLFMNGGVVAAGGSVNATESVLWAGIVAVSAGLLVQGSRSAGRVRQAWLRPSIWASAVNAASSD